MFTRSKHTAPRATALLAAIFSTAALGIALPMSDQTSTVFDPVGDSVFNDMPAFQDFVFGQMTKTASGDFQLLMEMAAPVPVAPRLPPRGHSEIWWFWAIGIDHTAVPLGYPWAEAAEAANFHGSPPGRAPQFIVYVSWNGTEFAGNAIDRRPLLTGGEAIVTPVTFSINGSIVEAVLPSELIGDFPTSFAWGVFTADWAGPVGSNSFNFADYQEARAVFNP